MLFSAGKPIRILLILAMVGLGALSSAEEIPHQLIVAPSRISLHSSTDRQSLVAQVRSADGSTKDVSAVVTWTVSNSTIADVDDLVVTATRDGSTELAAEYEGLRATIPVNVQGADEEPPVRFRNDVLAVLTHAGCNTGKCHGAASGKDGFRLSLFGYDPAGDHYRLSREISGRRINVANPEESLLIRKATGSVPHTGGARVEPGSAHYETLVRWLAEGALPDPSDTPYPIGIDVYPESAVFAAPGDEQRLTVVARYSDGSDRDVTDLSVFLSNNDGAATVTPEGLVAGTGAGAAFVLARFDQFTEGASIVVRPGTPFTFPDIPEANYIDELVYQRHRDMHISPSESCSDEQFLRRVYLDLIGILPSPAERERFLTDPSTDRREKLVIQLVERPEFSDIWSMKWAEILQVRTANGASLKALQLYDEWLRDEIRAGKTIDQVISQIIPATGGTFDNPATSYYQTETTPQLIAENVAQALIGTRIQCAQCHNHPFDRWTMDDYYGFAAFFSQVGYKRAQDPRELTVFNAATGEMKHPVDGRVVKPRFLGGSEPTIPADNDARDILSQWLANAGNRSFSENIANIVWAHFFGIGIVEPVDDVRVSNPPSNPALHRELGRRLAAYQFDIRPLVRDICSSQTYQLSTRRNRHNEWDERNFSHGKIRRLRAEILLDCINQVTEVRERFSGLPEGSRAVRIANGRTSHYFLTTFGRSTRETPCTCEVRTSPTLSQALHLLNGETTSGKIEEGQVVAALLAQHHDPLEVAGQLYVRSLTRLPTPDESEAIASRLSSADDAHVALTDLFWALLNSNEFLFNH
jgi:hypothetical protein